MIEKALITTLIVVIIAMAISFVGEKINATFHEVACDVGGQSVCVINEV